MRKIGSTANSRKARSNSASSAISIRMKSFPNCSTPLARCHDADPCQATSPTFEKSNFRKHPRARLSLMRQRSRKGLQLPFGKPRGCAEISPSSADLTFLHRSSATACAKRSAKNLAPPTAPTLAPTDPTRSTTWATSPRKALANRRISIFSSRPCERSPTISPKMAPPPTSSTALSNPLSAFSTSHCATTITGSTPS